MLSLHTWTHRLHTQNNSSLLPFSISTSIIIIIIIIIHIIITTAAAAGACERNTTSTEN